MQKQELQFQNDMLIRFIRLTAPVTNNSYIPLSGLYNPIDNNESNDYKLRNKFKNFDISSNQCVNIENLFSLNTSFGKLFINEQLEGILSIGNETDHHINIKDLSVTIKRDEKSENKKKSSKETIIHNVDIKLPNNLIDIAPHRAYYILIKDKLKIASKYGIDIKFHTTSKAFDQHYYKQKQRVLVKEETDNYIIKDGMVECINSKKLNFEVINPFYIIEKFYSSEVNICYIEIQLINNNLYPLTIYDLYLTTKKNKLQKIKLVKNIDEIINDKELNDSKYSIIQPDEQLNVLFKIDDPDLFNDEDSYLLNILWVKDFDFTPKTFVHEFSNSLMTYNNYYKIIISEKPSGDIIKSKNFKIVINLVTKNFKKKYIISLSQEPIKDQDDTNDREIEIIDILEKSIELNSKTPSNNFVLICKSDILGNVYLPPLKFSLYEGDKTNPIETIYKALLTFNCISRDKDYINE
jgi:hypothetical protein